jgi:hypothetical protein
MGLTGFQGDVVNSLNTQDARNQDLLDQVITAANEVSSNSANADVTLNGDPNSNAGESGAIRWGGKEASISGTGGVALLEYAKDAISTAVSNITGVGTSQIQLKKAAERKMSQG